MSFSAGRTSSSSLVVWLVIVSVLHIWVFSERNNRVGAIRVFPERGERHHRKMELKSNVVNQTEIFRKYFEKRISDLNGAAGGSRQNGTFQESKRRVPSCPDQLHNK